VAGTSLAEDQNRRLHLRGICSLLPEGLMHVEVQLHNPHGSTFYLLVERMDRAGTVRAPDSATLISAGIAFCFMTQIGRYAKIVRKDLREYRIVQDTHFSRAGSSQPGEADPVETHVHLVTGEDDDFAKTALRMSEQTCFLHALCRSLVAIEATLK
jgi:organic hydroperoxide reductase OsmC/OhrA